MNKFISFLGAGAAALFAGAATAQEIDYDREIPVADLRADFAALYEGLQSAHYDLYAHRAKAAFDARFDEMLAGLDAPLSLFETHVRFQEFVAYGNVAHARIDFPSEVYRQYREEGGRAFPIYPRIVDGRMYVGEDYSGAARIARGDEIVEIDGRPAAEWLARTARHLSADTPYIAHSLLEFSFPMYLWLEIGEVDAFRVRVRPQEGRARTVRIKALTSGEQETASRDQEQSFTLESDVREARMVDGDIAYLRPGPFYNFEDPSAVWDNRAFISFIDEAFEGFLSSGAQKLVIDIRENPGGDNSFSDFMVAWFADETFRFASAFLIRSSAEAEASNQARLDGNPGAAAGVSGLFARRYAETPHGEAFAFDIPEAHPRGGARFEGEVYVLINRHSYSNAVNVAALVQDYGFGAVLGEKTSDLATTYGAMETFSLPITGIAVGFPKAHIIRPSGETESDGVTPDIAIASPIAPQAEDVVLNEALRIVAAGE